MQPSGNGIPSTSSRQEVTARIQFCLDSSLPLGSSQHQKIVVIDNAVAFVGGLDLTIRRWDTSEHLAEHPLRRDPVGRPYPPFHDVQCMVEGEAAAALGEIASARWTAAGCTVEDCEAVECDRWPASVPAGARQIPGRHRADRAENRVAGGVDEVARLFEASIGAASRFIYIENQFASATEIAEALAQRMVDVPSLQRAHRDAEGAFVMAGIAGDAGRPRRLHPSVRRGRRRRPAAHSLSFGGRTTRSSAAVMVHSKVMIVDDGFLRIGSANINNRSMGADTECDLAFEATTEDHREFICEPAAPADRTFLRGG